MVITLQSMEYMIKATLLETNIFDHHHHEVDSLGSCLPQQLSGYRQEKGGRAIMVLEHAELLCAAI